MPILTYFIIIYNSWIYAFCQSKTRHAFISNNLLHLKYVKWFTRSVQNKLHR